MTPTARPPFAASSLPGGGAVAYSLRSRGEQATLSPRFQIACNSVIRLLKSKNTNYLGFRDYYNLEMKLFSNLKSRIFVYLNKPKRFGLFTRQTHCHDLLKQKLLMYLGSNIRIQYFLFAQIIHSLLSFSVLNWKDRPTAGHYMYSFRSCQTFRSVLLRPRFCLRFLQCRSPSVLLDETRISSDYP